MVLDFYKISLYNSAAGFLSVFVFNIFICHYGPLKSLFDIIDVLSCCTFFYFTHLQILKISLTSSSFCKQQLFFSDIHCCITDTVPCQDRCFGADASSSCIRKCSFFVKRFLKNETNVKLCIFQFSQSWEERISMFLFSVVFLYS